MSQRAKRWEGIDMTNPNNHYIMKMNQYLEEKDELVPRITDHTLFVGTTKSGKSWVIKQLLYSDLVGIYDRIVFFSTTFDAENYSEIFEIPKKDIFTEPEESDLMEVIEESKERFFKANGNYFTLIILDDIVDGTKQWKNFNKVISKCRHYGITLWMSIQYPKFVSKPVRQQISSIFIWCNMTDENIDNISDICPCGKKKTREGIEAIRNIAREEKIPHAFMHQSKNRPGLINMNLEEDISIFK